MKKSRHYQLPTNNELTTNHYPLITTIATALKNCPPETVLLASVSGGADSMAMLAALVAIRDQGSGIGDQGIGNGETANGITLGAGLKLRCIHVEHGIRPAAESQGDAEFVRSFCKKIGVPCHVTCIKPGKAAALAKSRGIGIEAAARLYRRRAWRRHLRRLETEGRQLEAEDRQTRPPPIRILVAHTADDMRETTLMRILRGSGPNGLAAMPASRGRILRPLISLSRRDVLDYLTAKNIAWREDSTNTDTKLLRNRIRRLLIPQLNEHFPQWGGAIAALAETQSLTAEFIRKEAKRRIKWGLGIRDWGLGTGVMHFFTNTKTFLAQPAIIREEALFQGINRLGIPAKIKRANIRHFAQGELHAVDLGPLLLRKNAQQVTISEKGLGIRDWGLGTGEDYFDNVALTSNNPRSLIPDPRSLFSETHLSLLIKAPGSYNLKGIAIEVADVHPTDLHPADGHQNVFFSPLPLVFRPWFGEFPMDTPSATADSVIIAAMDPLGVAAFIGQDGLFLCRGNRVEENQVAAQNADNRKRYMVRVTVTALQEAAQNEGMDVRRQK